ncbi:MAG: hypothetical protein AAFZ04_15205 [Pseudomonadota bacterium]
MGFTPSSLDLQGERVSEAFGTIRANGCPHKGIDVTSSRKPKTFSAGVFGVVGAPVGGKWGTVTVHPLHARSDRIQYLHCSSIIVQTGQNVVPWSVLGTTGDVAPPDSGITGIHLHLQVQKPGAGRACWNNRLFVDPATYPTPDMFRGTWRNQYANQQGPLYVEYENTLNISSSATIGEAGTAQMVARASASGCTWVFRFRWKLFVTARNLNGTLSVATRNGTQNRPVACGIPGGWTAQDGTADLRLDSQTLLSVVQQGPINGSYHKVSSAVEDWDSQIDLMSVEADTPHVQISSEMSKANAYFFDQLRSLSDLAAAFETDLIKRGDPDEIAIYFGATQDEVF